MKGCIFCLGIIPNIVLCQDLKSDSSFLANSITHAKAIHSKAMASETGLFNGVEYRAIIQHTFDEGHPYFLSDDWIVGTLHYDGSAYQEIAMQYDLIRDKLVIDFPLFQLELISEKVQSFELAGHKFVRLSVDTMKSSIKPGFYELQYDGKVKTYTKHIKEKKEEIASDQLKYIFNDRNRYYIFKDNIYHQVKSKSSVLKTFYTKKSMLRKYISKNKIDFRKDPVLAIARSAKFYEESENQP